MLFGGRKGQTLKWYVPSRRSNNDDESNWEDGYESDLYYADIYKWNEGTGQLEFEDWDSNGNNIFAEWKGWNKDVMDFLPDICIGRIPCRYSFEANVAVNKIIKYETTADDSWFKKAFVISGDTVPPARGGSPGWYEGEMETAITADLLDDVGFDVEKLWTTNEGFKSKTDVIKAITSGAGFVHFAGHGNPALWGNFIPEAATEKEFIIGLELKDMYKLRNGNKLPVIIVGGCHTAQFNVTMMNIVLGILAHGVKGYFNGDFWEKEWVPHDFCSWLLIKRGGGAIGTMGNTGLGYIYANQYATAGLSGWIEPRFFDAYASQGKEFLGDAHSQAITDYINIIDNVNSEHIDRKTIEEWVLLGDPSLKLGGY